MWEPVAKIQKLKTYDFRIALISSIKISRCANALVHRTGISLASISQISILIGMVCHLREIIAQRHHGASK